MSNITTIRGTTIPSIVGFPGAYNLAKGLARWYSCRDSFSTPLLHIVTLGDSIEMGFGANNATYLDQNYARFTPSAILRALLRKQLNPSNIGGEGFIGFETSGEVGRWNNRCSYGGGWSRNNQSYFGLSQAYISAGTTLLSCSFDGARYGKNPYYAQDVTNFGLCFTGDIDKYIDIDVYAGLATGAIGSGDCGKITAKQLNIKTTPAGTAAATDYGVHSGLLALTSATKAITKESQYTIQIARNAGSGSAGSNGSNLAMHGIYAYNGDESCGVHVTNASLSGNTFALCNSAGANSKNSIAQFFSETNGLASTRASLIITNIIINYWINGTSIATMLSDITTYMTTVLAYTSKPCVLFKIPQYLAHGTYTDAQYQAYATALINYVTSTWPNDAAVISVIEFDSFIGTAGYQAEGLTFSDTNKHPNRKGMFRDGWLISQALLAG